MHLFEMVFQAQGPNNGCQVHPLQSKILDTVLFLYRNFHIIHKVSCWPIFKIKSIFNLKIINLSEIHTWFQRKFPGNSTCTSGVLLVSFTVRICCLFIWSFVLSLISVKFSFTDSRFSQPILLNSLRIWV